MRPSPTTVRLSRAIVLGSICAGLATALPAVASAAPHACQQRASISSRTGVIDHNFTHAPDAQGSFATPLAGLPLHVGHAYQLGASNVIIKFGETRFAVRARSVFSLGCYGQVVGGPLLPSLHLQSGSVRVAASVSHPGGVDTTEALANPVLGYSHRLTFTVTRRLTVPAQMTEPGMFFDTRGYINAPLGTTTVATLGTGYTNITPYVGAKPGTCRHADSARLRSTGRARHNFTGLATYHGLH
ncbi:MAG: hypothetical protein QOG59_1096 [Solirubrobacteraceae bacterium]|nr:hypothetical protein [Solirubrobacteraceae bacterium]